mgnify:CR=1 FL=1
MFQNNCEVIKLTQNTMLYEDRDDSLPKGAACNDNASKTEDSIRFQNRWSAGPTINANRVSPLKDQNRGLLKMTIFTSILYNANPNRTKMTSRPASTNDCRILSFSFKRITYNRATHNHDTPTNSQIRTGQSPLRYQNSTY